MSYYNKDDEHKYKFAIWVAVCFGVFLLITIIVVICSIFVYNKKMGDDDSRTSNSKAVESMFSSVSAQGYMSTAQSSKSTASSSSARASTSSSSASSQASSGSQTSSAFADFIANLPVTCIRQNPELPQGCEVTSLAIAMNYKGYKIDKVDMARSYLPRVEMTDDLSQAANFFIGDPSKDPTGGLYCLEGAIVKTIENYNKENTPVKYKTLSGTSDLYSELEKGNPVIVWVTLWNNNDFADPDLKAFNSYTAYYNLHCMVLTGYSKDKVALADPLADTSDPQNGIRIIAKDRFESIWKSIGQRAISIQ